MLFRSLLSPVTAVLIAISNVFLKIFRQKTDVDEEVYTEEDVMSMLKAGKESGVFNEEGTKMISAPSLLSTISWLTK